MGEALEVAKLCEVADGKRTQSAVVLVAMSPPRNVLTCPLKYRTQFLLSADAELSP